MIRYLFGTQLPEFPDLAAAMFLARAAQGDKADAVGWGTDAFDGLDPLYVVLCDADGGHAGSMRFLPTTGPTMLGNRVPSPISASPRDPEVWEGSKLCLALGAGDDVAQRMLLAMSELGLGLGLRACLGVIETPTVRACQRLGWPAHVMAYRAGIAAVRWTFDTGRHDALCAAAGVTARQSRDEWEVTFRDLATAPLSVRV